MTLTPRHVMESNMRLIRQVKRVLFGDHDRVWGRIVSEFCKEHGALMPDRVMQFKYKGEVFSIPGDVRLRAGVKPLHESLEGRFSEAYQMFVTEVDAEEQILQNMLSHAIRIAKTAEDMVELLPECLAPAVEEAGFFQMPDKPPMSIDDLNHFRSLYEQYYSLFDTRKFLGKSL